MQRLLANSDPTDFSARSKCASPASETFEPPAHIEGLDLQFARLLLVEDDFIILMELETILSGAGAQILGSCRTVEAALTLANHADIHAALLDSRVGRQSITPVARSLALREIPFAFYTAQSASDSTLAEWPQCVILGKPATPKAIVATVAALLRRC